MGKKWNPDARPGEKMLVLFTMLLYSSRELSLNELSAALGCSKQSVLRLLEQFESSRFGALTRSKKGKETAYRLDSPKKLPKIILDAQSLGQLALCRDFVLHLLPESMRSDTDIALRQAASFLPAESLPPESKAFSLTKGRIDYTPFQSTLQTLINGIYEHRICSISYRSALHEEARDFIYAPKRLIAFHEALYISGWIVSAKAEALYTNPTIFALHRIRKASLSLRSSKHLPEPEDKNKGAFGLMQAESFSASVLFDKSVATYVAEREWSSKQKAVVNKDGGITLRMTAQSAPEFISWVLSFGEKAEVISPAWLRNLVAEKASALSGLYARNTAKK